MIRLIGLSVLLCLALSAVAQRMVLAQWDGVMNVAQRGAGTSAIPTGFSPNVATVPDNCCASAGITLATLAVTTSNGSQFNGTCLDTDASGLTQLLPSVGGCTLQSKRAFTSADDGVYQLTLNMCIGGTSCLNPRATNFTLTVAAVAPAFVQNYIDQPGGAPCCSWDTAFPGNGNTTTLQCSSQYTAHGGTAIRTGDTVIGQMHTSDWNDAVYMAPGRIYDDKGNTYNIAGPVQWQPYPEAVTTFWATNVQGNPTTILGDFSAYSGQGLTPLCNILLTEYSGVNSVVTAGPTRFVGPGITGGTTTPAISVSATVANSILWGSGAVCLNGSTICTQSTVIPSGYNILIGTGWSWDNNQTIQFPTLVAAGTYTQQWNLSQLSGSTCAGAPYGCSAVLAAAVLQPVASGAQPQPTAITLTSGSAPDTSASGALIATINSSNVTMSLGGTFGGTCSVTDTNTTGPGPGGTYVASGGASGCNIVTAAAYTSANDGPHGNITLQACQNGGCASQAFTLTITAPGSGPAPALAGCSSSTHDGITGAAGGPSNGSCFSTQIYDFDFSGATACTNPGCAFPGHPANYYQTVSNWLDCKGASSPEWYLNPSGSGPCNDVSVVNDGGTMALQMVGTQADHDTNCASQGGGICGMGMGQFAANPGTMHFPVGDYYVQFTFRKSPAQDTNRADIWTFQNTAWNYTGSNANAWCGSSSCGVNSLEQDYMENVGAVSPATVSDAGGWLEGEGAGVNSFLAICTSNANNDGDTTFCSPPDGPGGLDFRNFVPSPPYDPTNYVTFGRRFTTDGTGNVSSCWYYAPGINPTSLQFAGCELVCNTSNTTACANADPSQFNKSFQANQTTYDRTNLVLWWGNNNSGSNATLWLEKEEVWACSAWNTGWSGNGNPSTITSNPCSGIVITGP